MSRHKAKETFKLEEFKESMKNIYTTSVVEETIDEAPFVYKTNARNNRQHTRYSRNRKSNKTSI